MEPDQLASAKQILIEVRDRIQEEANGSPALTFAMRRYIYKNLSYDERGTPGNARN